MTLPDLPDDQPSQAERSRWTHNLDDELSGAELYDALAKAESNPELAHVFSRLSQIEESHAQYWRGKLEEVGGHGNLHRTPLRSRALMWLARRFGPAVVLRAVHAAEVRDGDRYAGQPDASDLSSQEHGHARVLASALASETGRRITGRDIATLEGRHRSGGNALRAAVLGANDGLLSNFSLVMGMAGGAAAASTVVLAGIAGLVAGAFSMALGEWLSVTNARELYRSQIEAEREELRANPEEERVELALIYQTKGIPQDEAEALAARIVGNTDAALDTLAREELGLEPSDLGGSAMTAALTSFCLFALGAAIPLVPLMATKGTSALVAAIVASAIGLAAFGAAAALVTGQNLWRGALRQLATGGIAAGATFAIGKIVGQSIGG